MVNINFNLHWFILERFLYDREIKTHKQNRNNKQTEIEQFDWFIKQIQTCVVFSWLSEPWMKNLHAGELSRNQPILPFDFILQHDWPIEQCLLHIRFFFGGKKKRPCFDLFIHWLIKQITNSCQNHFSRSYVFLLLYQRSFFSKWALSELPHQTKLSVNGACLFQLNCIILSSCRRTSLTLLCE